MKHTIILLLFSCALWGQTSNTEKIIQLKPYTLQKKVCVLFQNDSFLIMTSTKYLVDLYSTSNESDSWFIKEKELFKECNNSKLDTINFYLYLQKKSLEHIAINHAADLMGKNKCVVLNKKTNKEVLKVIIKPYSHFDVAGMAYYIENKLLFETIETVY